MDHTSVENWLYGIFGAIVIAFLLLDLGLFNRKSHKVTFTQALIQSGVMVAISFGFGWLVFQKDGADAGLAYITAYLTEYALSVDNIFVFIIILRFFKVPESLHHKVLYYGVIGAMVFRAIFILLGEIMVEQFHWVLYIFGAFLIYSGIKMLIEKEDDDFDPGQSLIYKFSARQLRMIPDISSGKLITRIDGKWFTTTLFVVVLLIETSDIIFAVDSIPAVFGATQSIQDGHTKIFVIYTSNIFAILGLRSMFFMLQGIMHRFHLLGKGVALVLTFIGIKMLGDIFSIHIENSLSLTIIVAILSSSILLSLIIKPKQQSEHQEGQSEPEEEG